MNEETLKKYAAYALLEGKNRIPKEALDKAIEDFELSSEEIDGFIVLKKVRK